MRGRVLLALGGLLLAGCADAAPPPEDGAGPDVPAPPAAATHQEFRGGMAALTPFTCLVAHGDEAGAGLVHDALAVDERTKGQPFTAYVNATGTLVGVGLEFLYEGSDPASDYFGGTPGRAMTGHVPDKAVPMRIAFQACGAGLEAVSIVYWATQA